MSITILDLEKVGFTIKIRHKRKFKLTLPNDSEKCIFVTKGQIKFDNKGEIGKLLDYASNNLKFELDNNGGITEISIFDAAKVLVGAGEARCGRGDNFNKRLATSIALGRACISAGIDKKYLEGMKNVSQTQ